MDIDGIISGSCFYDRKPIRIHLDTVPELDPGSVFLELEFRSELTAWWIYEVTGRHSDRILEVVMKSSCFVLGINGEYRWDPDRAGLSPEINGCEFYKLVKREVKLPVGIDRFHDIEL